MTQPASVGTLSKFKLNGVLYEYKSFGLGKHGTVLAADGIRGTRAHPVERTVAGPYTVSGAINWEPGPTTLTNLWPFILGTSGALTETLATFAVVIDRIAQVHTFNTCKVDRAVFKGTQGQLIDMTLDIEGESEALSGSVSGTPTLDVPFLFNSATLSIGGTAYQFREFSLTVDNHLKKDRFMNSLTRTDLPELDRTVSLSLSLPYTTDDIAIYDANATSAAVVLTWLSGATTVTLTMAAVQFPTEPPSTPGRDEILLPQNGIARKTGSTLELVIS